MTPESYAALRAKLGLTHKEIAAKVGRAERSSKRWESDGIQDAAIIRLLHQIEA